MIIVIKFGPAETKYIPWPTDLEHDKRTNAMWHWLNKHHPGWTSWSVEPTATKYLTNP